MGEAVVGVMGESGAWGGGVAHRGRFLEFDLDAAAGGVCDGLLRLIVEVVEPQAAAGRPHGGGVGHTGAGARATLPSGRRTWPRSTRRTMGGAAFDCVWTGRVATCVDVCLRAGLGSGRTREKEMLGKGQRKERACFLTWVWRRAGKEVLGKGQGKECARLLTLLGMCAGEGRKSVCKCVSGP